MNYLSNLTFLNSLTKYPSIPTYHKLGERGRLTEELNVLFSPDDDIVLTEKIDGLNARIIIEPGGSFILGSREELLFRRQDVIGNNAYGIKEQLWLTADRCADAWSMPGQLSVLYVELFGGNTTKAAANYRGEEKGAFFVRLIDAAEFTFTEMQELAGTSPDWLAGWRDNGGQRFMHEVDLANVARQAQLREIDLRLAPRIDDKEAFQQHPPASVLETYVWMTQLISRSMVGLPDAPAEPEGIVVRTADRKKIVKLRFEDYEKTLGKNIKSLRDERLALTEKTRELEEKTGTPDYKARLGNLTVSDEARIREENSAEVGAEV